MKASFTAASIAIALLIFGACASRKIDPYPYQEVLYYTDVTYTKAERLKFCILGENGARYGRTVAVWKVGPNGKFKRIYIDRDRGFKPWKILACELDGDPLPEIAVGVYKSTRFFPDPDNRLFIYDWTGKFLSPKWLGSRLALPFVDFAFIRGNDSTDRLVALEHWHGKEFFLRMYKWNGFGFISESDPIQVKSNEAGLKALQSLREGRPWSEISERK